MSADSTTNKTDWHQHGNTYVWVAPGASCELCIAPPSDNVVTVQMPNYTVTFVKTPGWEKRLNQATLEEGKRLKKEREAPAKKRMAKTQPPPPPQADFGELFDDEDLAG